MELCGDSLGRQAFGFVHGKEHWPPGAAQQLGNGLVLYGQPLAAINEKDHDIGLGNGLLRLPRHLMHDAALRLRLEATGIDHQIGSSAAATATVMPITS